MTHIAVLFHAVEHINNEEQSTTYLKFEKVTDSEQDCSICDIYKDIQLSEVPNNTFTLFIPNLILNKVIEPKKDVTTTLFSVKKSRAPPFYS